MIRTKAEFYAEQRAGRCGNYYAQHYSYVELIASGYVGRVSVRDVTRGGRSGRTRELHKVLVKDLPKSLQSLHCNDGVAFLPTPPDEHIVLQGEFSLNGGIGELRYTFVQEPMLVAFKKQDLRATGLRARMILRKYLTDADLEMIYNLIEQYTDHTNVDTPVIEFTSYDVRVGAYDRYTVIWEIRSY